MKGAKVLVTGGAGFIGSHLVERLCERNEVTILDDLSTGSLRNLGGVRREVVIHKGSVLDEKVLSKALKGHEVVYHLAAKTSVAESVERPKDYWQTNVEGTVLALKTAIEAGVRRFVFASSAAIYGNIEANPKVESMKPTPASPYATTKMVGEFACEEAGSLKDLDAVVLRIFNVYGPRQDPRSTYGGVVARFSAAVATGGLIEVYGDGEQTRDFLYASDLAEALELAGEKQVRRGVFNIGSGQVTSVNEVIELLTEITGTRLQTVRMAARPGDVRHSRADISKAIASLDFTPRTSLRQGLERTVEFYRMQSKAT